MTYAISNLIINKLTYIWNHGIYGIMNHGIIEYMESWNHKEYMESLVYEIMDHRVYGIMSIWNHGIYGMQVYNAIIIMHRFSSL